MEFKWMSRFVMVKWKYVVLGCTIVFYINAWSFINSKFNLVNAAGRCFHSRIGPLKGNDLHVDPGNAEIKRPTRAILATLEKLLTSVRNNQSTENDEASTISAINLTRISPFHHALAREKLPGLDSMDKYLKLPPRTLAADTVTDEPTYSFSQRRDYNFIISHNNSCSQIDSKNFTVSGESYGTNENIFILLVVKSICRSTARRQAIRQTWGNVSWISHNLGINTRVYFLLGACENSRDQEQVFRENSKYSDILQWDFVDSFRNLTLKECLYLQWYANHCRKVPFIFKGDDDVFVNIKNIVQFLQHLHENETQSLFIGSKLVNSPRILNPKSKYYVSSNLYPGKYYPPYLSGGGFLLSGDVAVKFFTESLQTRMIPIDDAFLGILSKSLGIEPKNDRDFKSWGMKDRDPCNLAKIKTLHRASPKSMISMWKSLTTVNMTEC